MNSSQLFPRPHEQTAGRVYDGEAVLVLADISEINVLNAVGSRIFELADGRRSIDEIVDVIVDEFDVVRESAARDVAEFLDSLVDANVMTYEKGAA